MSAAIALPRQDHRVSHSPHEAPNQRYYQPIAPSRSSTYGSQRSPVPMTSSPARLTSGSEQHSAYSRPQQDSHNASQPQQVASSAASTGSPTGSRASDSRTPLTAPMPQIKTERAPSPGPPPPSARRRPQRLDLNTSTPPVMGNGSAGPHTAKESGGLSSMQEVATACLSPGIDTTDPKVRQQMERSREMAEQQRAIIAQRQMKSGGKGAESSGSKPADFGPPPSASFSKPAGGPIRKKAPPSSLSLAAAGAYSSEPRVIQSAPLHHSFTGLQRPSHPLSRQVLEHSHQHAMGYGQPNPRQSEQHPFGQVSSPHSTRLPPIADVFANEGLPSSRPAPTLIRTHSGPDSANHNSSQRPLYAPLTSATEPRPPHSNNPSPVRPPHYDPIETRDFPRPPSNHESFMRSTAISHPSQQSLAPPEREREYRSAEEAMHSLVGGRTELLPKAVHYGGHQPPTPPSPLPPMGYPPHPSARTYPPPTNLKVETGERIERRRTRDEFERDHPDAAADEAERDRERNRRRAEENNSATTGLGFGFGALRNESRTTRSPETERKRKEEFMTICARAWDLLQGAE